MATLLGQHPAVDRRLVIEPLDGEEIDDAAMHAGFQVARTIDDARDARMQNGASAHGAGFQRHEKFAARQAVVVEIARRVA